MRRAHLKAIFQKWYWRALVAVIVGTVSVFFSEALIDVLFHIIEIVFTWVSAITITLAWIRTIAQALVGLTISVLALGTYIALTHFYGNIYIDNEIHCRKCGYILRGISEPRCSECGERI